MCIKTPVWETVLHANTGCQYRLSRLYDRRAYIETAPANLCFLFLPRKLLAEHKRKRKQHRHKKLEILGGKI